VEDPQGKKIDSQISTSMVSGNPLHVQTNWHPKKEEAKAPLKRMTTFKKGVQKMEENKYAE